MSFLHCTFKIKIRILGFLCRVRHDFFKLNVCQFFLYTKIHVWKDVSHIKQKTDITKLEVEAGHRLCFDSGFEAGEATWEASEYLIFSWDSLRAIFSSALSTCLPTLRAFVIIFCADFAAQAAASTLSDLLTRDIQSFSHIVECLLCV